MDIKPFKALRPTRDKAYLVASRSYVTYEDEKLRDKLLNNPYTFLQIIHPDRYGEPQSFGEERFRKVKMRFEEFQEKGIFLKEEKECFYVYKQIHHDRSHTGIIGAVAIEDYLKGHIKKHENTIQAREEMFKDYLDVTGFNAEPVLLSHPFSSELKELLNECCTDRAEYEFTSTDEILHLLWPISDEKWVKQLKEVYQSMPDLYIADGHHRTASSALLYQESPSISNSHFMAMLMDENEMHFSPFSRLVRHSFRSLNSVKKALTKDFDLVKVDEPGELKGHEFQMYADGEWYDIRFKEGFAIPEDPAEALNPSLMAKYILNPVFDIFDQRTDERLAFLPDTDNGLSLKEKIDSGKYEFGFRMASLSGVDVRNVADANEVMPPKSTYISPKLRSGLLIYSLSND